MMDTPRRLFLAVGALALIWIITYWLYEPTPPPVTFGDRPASLSERDLVVDRDDRPAPTPPPRLVSKPQPPTQQPPEPRPEAAKPQPKAEPPPVVAAPPPVTPIPPTAPAAPSRRVREYTIASGDTSWAAIAQRTLGDSRRGQAIADENPLVDPRKLIPGRTVVRIPLEASDPEPVTVASAPPPAAPAAPAGKTYVISDGDTLSGIAKQVYGQSSQWKAIYEANKSVIPNPDRLPLGVTIQIPPK